MNDLGMHQVSDRPVRRLHRDPTRDRPDAIRPEIIVVPQGGQLNVSVALQPQVDESGDHLPPEGACICVGERKELVGALRGRRVDDGAAGRVPILARPGQISQERLRRDLDGAAARPLDHVELVGLRVDQPYLMWGSLWCV